MTPRARSRPPWPASKARAYHRDCRSGCSRSLRGPSPTRPRPLAIGARTPDQAVARLSSLHGRYPEVIVTPEALGMYQLQLRAMQALYDAEVLRGQADSEAATLWRHAAEACRDAELAWDEAYARRRAAEALLQDRATRQQGVRRAAAGA